LIVVIVVKWETGGINVRCNVIENGAGFLRGAYTNARHGQRLKID